ncbi:hypothetical protein DY218_23425 [Streptomyces triticagri]|uniref:SH3 domain-containing protein n=2 Tax=Streptomyces triticagri TaxID=2293568 RepID=A0A372M1C7_9ACTN|nr:hypothetical protein DY218_23425 [Streptomyces triticagri]
MRAYGRKRLAVTAVAGAAMIALTAGACGETSDQNGKAAGTKAAEARGDGAAAGGAGQDGAGEAIANQAATSGGGGGTGGTGAGRGHQVKVWKKVKVRMRPDQRTKHLSNIGKGAKVTARCWTIGRMVQAEGTNNEIWLSVKNGWASAIYFKGDKYAGLPKRARC